MERVCLYCNNTVPVNKRGGSQKLRVFGEGGEEKEMFLCRHHKIKNFDANRVYDMSYFDHLFKKK